MAWILLQNTQNSKDFQAQVYYALNGNFSGGSETTNLISPRKYTNTRKSQESHSQGLKSQLQIGRSTKLMRVSVLGVRCARLGSGS